MRRIINWTEGNIQSMSVWYFGLVKIALILFGMILGAYWATFVKEYIYHFVIVWLVLYVIVAHKFLKKKPKRKK